MASHRVKAAIGTSTTLRIGTRIENDGNRLTPTITGGEDTRSSMWTDKFVRWNMKQIKTGSGRRFARTNPAPSPERREELCSPTTSTISSKALEVSYKTLDMYRNKRLDITSHSVCVFFFLEACKIIQLILTFVRISNNSYLFFCFRILSCSHFKETRKLPRQRASGSY